MSLGDDIVILETTSTEVKNRILKSHELLRAIDTGALYIGGKDGKPQALIAGSTTPDVGIDLYAFARAMRSSVIVGTAPADAMGSAVATAQKLWSAKINAGAMKLGDTLRIMLGLLKSGTVDTATFTIRVGATDSAADAAIMSITLTTSSFTYGALHHFKAVSSSALRQGGVNSSTNSLPGSSGNAPASPVTVGDFSASDVYVGIYCTMTTGSEFPTVRNAILELIPGV